jgi:hypothetical protein
MKAKGKNILVGLGLLALLAACSQPAPQTKPPSKSGDVQALSTSTAGCDVPALIAAINAANDETTNPGPDTINLETGCTYTLTVANNVNNGLPIVASEIEINGNGATIRRDSAAPLFRILEVASGAKLTLNSLTITGGRPSAVSNFDGGGGILNGGTLTLNNSSVSGNTAQFGGGIKSPGTLALNSSTVSGNSAAFGGGIGNQGTATLNSSTVSDNTANQRGPSGDSGGGIYNRRTLTLKNSIIANSTGEDCISDSGMVTADSSHNVIEDSANACGLTNGVNGNIVGFDPNLGPLQDNGGPTFTHALLPGSPAINVGNNGNIPSGITTDQRGAGFDRIKGGTVDIGAFEVQITDTTAPVITPTLSGTLGSNGWYTSTVTVSWSVVDNESAVSSQSGCDPTPLSSDTAGTTLTCTATSGGGSNSQSVTVRIDRTAPTVSGTVSPNPVLQNLSASATPSASDALSGVVGSSCAPVNTSTVGTNLSVACTATDGAGNVGSGTASYTVISASTATSNLTIQVRSMGLGNLENPLLAKLRAAQADLAAGNRAGAIADLTNFINQLNAQRGKRITSAQADALIAVANQIIQSIRAGN